MSYRPRPRLSAALLVLLWVLLLGGAGSYYACSGDEFPSSLGQPCSASEPCGPDTVCDPALGVCVEPTDGGGTTFPDGGVGDGAGFIDAFGTGT